MASEPRARTTPRYLNPRPTNLQHPGIPDLPKEPSRRPTDPPDEDGVQGDEGGGDYRGPREHPSKRKR